MARDLPPPTGSVEGNSCRNLSLETQRRVKTKLSLVSVTLKNRLRLTTETAGERAAAQGPWALGRVGLREERQAAAVAPRPGPSVPHSSVPAGRLVSRRKVMSAAATCQPPTGLRGLGGLETHTRRNNSLGPGHAWAGRPLKPLPGSPPQSSPSLGRPPGARGSPGAELQEGLRVVWKTVQGLGRLWVPSTWLLVPKTR